ncbi:transmembrane protein 154 isoform X2 [Colossoma macropomum]|uniref:transmembrane protein 154 isoform X2 n=1 Tax=Colossoma macropomum TaxID=42526 RepID=UPI00186559E5|nr:transmembrane protein 154 isoform X2 [Colossoma macropomum]
MSPKLLLLILALTASLIAPQVHCETDDSSGDAETETHNTEEIPATDEETGHTVSTQSEVTKPTQSYTWDAQKSVTTAQTINSTQTQNRTQRERKRSSITATVLPTESATGPEESDPTEEPVSDFTVIMVALVLVLVLILMAIFIAALLISRRKRETANALKEDPYLDAEGREKVPMPMFEEDVPSVMELEMEDLEKWMIKGDGGISMDSGQKQFS